MTKYTVEHEVTGDDGETVDVRHYLVVKCDSCGEERTVEHMDQLIGGWYVDNDFCKQGVHLCPSCRYQGATVDFLQFGLHPSKYGVDIIGALKSTLRICGNIEQYLGELKTLCTRYTNDKQEETHKRISETIVNITNLLDMARANDKVAIAELMEFGK